MARYECKYYITPQQYESVIRWIEPYVETEQIAAKYTRNRYMLSSLYLDTPDLTLGRMTVKAIKNRFKLRIRTYGDTEDHPVFFEIKRRVNKVIDKQRAKVRRADGYRLMRGEVFPHQLNLPPDHYHDLETFMHLMTTQECGPVMRVRYEREAYQALQGEPVRLTFDRKLGFINTPDVNFDLGGEGWTDVPTEGIIFEVKFPQYFPFWVDELIHTLQLQAISIPKYIMSLENSPDVTKRQLLMLEGVL